MKTLRKMSLLMLLQLLTINAMPLQFPLLQPMPGTLQQQQLALQEQMLAIQQFQALQRFNPLPSPLAMNPQQPLLVLFPNDSDEKNERLTKLNENIAVKNADSDDPDSIAINAEPEDSLEAEPRTPMRAMLLLPNTPRFSIGGIIGSLPFLPIEINVPDSISWIYDGISGIISGIGQRWPFNRPQTTDNQNENTKSIWKDFKMKKIMPIVVMPLGQPILPMQL